jgi:GT2 family glycosyltransferase
LPKCGVVILTYESREPLREALASAFNQTYAEVEVVVVDNASTDGTVEMVRRDFPRAILIQNPDNAGTAAINLGIERALRDGCESVVLVDSDAILDGDALTKLAGVLDSHPKVGVAGPSCYENDYFGASPVVSVDPRSGLLRTVKYVKETSETDCIGIAMIRKQVFQKIGMIDPAFFAYYQDTDFSLRARRHGFGIVIVPETKFHHLGAFGTGKVCGLRGFISFRNRALLIRKNFSSRNFLWFYLSMPVALVKILAQWIQLRQGREFQATIISAISGISFIAAGREAYTLRRIAMSLVGYRIALERGEIRVARGS